MLEETHMWPKYYVNFAWNKELRHFNHQYKELCNYVVHLSLTVAIIGLFFKVLRILLEYWFLLRQMIRGSLENGKQTDDVENYFRSYYQWKWIVGTWVVWWRRRQCLSEQLNKVNNSQRFPTSVSANISCFHLLLLFQFKLHMWVEYLPCFCFTQWCHI